jgi:HEXXH motif-containing protein
VSPVLTSAQFAAIGSGYGDAAAMRVLALGQLAKRKALVTMVLRAARRAGLAEGPDRAAEVLERAERVRPDAVAEVLAHPHLDAWAMLCLHRLSDPDGGDQAGSRPIVDELAHLAAVAVAAACAAGIDVELDLSTLDGAACVPGLGTATGLGVGAARVTGDGAALRFVGAAGTVVHRGGPGWHALRSVRLGAGHSLTVEDQDPYRNCYQWLPLPLLTDSQADGFATLLTGAWQLVARDHPQHAVGIRQSLRSVVPLATPRPGMTISAASRHAYGSIAVSIPDTAAELALLLLHEYMHAKLGGLLDLCDLHGREQSGRYHAPWRLDPRPVGALLQGVYAHAGVTDYWRRRRLSPDADHRRAHAQFAYWRAQNMLAAQALSRGGELTTAGQRFMAALRTTLDEWEAEQVPLEIAVEVPLFVLAQTVRWRLLNWRPDPDEIAALLGAWRSAAAPGPVRAEGTVVPSQVAGPADAPGVLAVLRRWLGADPTSTTTATDDAATMLVSGDPAGAGKAYLRRLDRAGADHDAWIGLAVVRQFEAARGGRVDGATRLLADRPDLLLAAVVELQSRESQAATVLLAWLGDFWPCV